MQYPILTDGIFLIKQAEGLRLKAYKDSGGIITIGYGHTKSVVPGGVISELQAELFLIEDLLDTLKNIDKYVKVPIDAFQKAALASFVFNVGGNKFRTSTLLRLLNESNYKGASEQFKQWIYSKDKQGKMIERSWQKKRRQAEAKLFQGIGWGIISKEWDLT